MNFYPIFLNLKGRRCLVVGGGEVAQRKVERLLDCGAEVVIISKELSPGLKALAAEGLISHMDSDYRQGLIKAAVLVIGATDDTEINEAVRQESARVGALVNIVDDPERCDFILPSIFKRGDLQVAISTAGASPALAKKLREELEQGFGDEYGSFLKLMGTLRKKMMERGGAPRENKVIFEAIVRSNVLELIREKKWDEARHVVFRLSGEEIGPEIFE